MNEVSKQGLNLLTYNGNTITIPKDKLNIYMGIGLWSVKDHLSEGLPIDVMQMLLSAALIRSQIMEANSAKPSKVILLIADSMAIREGAEKEKVLGLVQLYKKSLEPLLDLLNLKESSQFMLSSDLELSNDFQEVHKLVGSLLQLEDKVHSSYIRNQTAITRYMNQYEHVGIKVGWICSDSSKQLEGQKPALSLKGWDELKFDRLCQEICLDFSMQYLYTRAGLKQSKENKHIVVKEGCPYTAYSKDQRYTIQTQDKKEIKTICPIQNSVTKHWIKVAQVCSEIIQSGLVKSSLLPKNCIQKSNDKSTVYNMLNYWTNPIQATEE